MPHNHEIAYPGGLKQETMPDGSQQLFGTDANGAMHRVDYDWVLNDYEDAAGDPYKPQGPRPPAEYTNDFDEIIQRTDKNGVNRLYGVDDQGKKKAVSYGRILLAHGYDPKKDMQGKEPVISQAELQARADRSAQLAAFTLSAIERMNAAPIQVIKHGDIMVKGKPIKKGYKGPGIFTPVSMSVGRNHTPNGGYANDGTKRRRRDAQGHIIPMWKDDGTLDEKEKAKVVKYVKDPETNVDVASGDRYHRRETSNRNSRAYHADRRSRVGHNERTERDLSLRYGNGYSNRHRARVRRQARHYENSHRARHSLGRMARYVANVYGHGRGV